LDKKLEKLVGELGEAINNAINESAEVNEMIDRIRAAGHDILLVLEATIAFKDDPDHPTEEPRPFKEISVDERMAEISSEDRQFLKSLKIKFD
jgi:hypothetical protein